MGVPGWVEHIKMPMSIYVCMWDVLAVCRYVCIWVDIMIYGHKSLILLQVPPTGRSGTQFWETITENSLIYLNRYIIDNFCCYSFTPFLSLVFPTSYLTLFLKNKMSCLLSLKSNLTIYYNYKVYLHITKISHSVGRGRFGVFSSVWHLSLTTNTPRSLPRLWPLMAATPLQAIWRRFQHLPHPNCLCRNYALAFQCLEYHAAAGRRS